MKIRTSFLSTVLLIAALHLNAAAPADPLSENFIAPEVIDAAREDVGFPETLQKKLREELLQAQPRFQDLEKKLQREQQKLVELTRNTHVDLEALRAQLDKVLSAEAEARRLHLKTLATIKNLLSEKQQADLRKWQRDHPGQAGQEFRAQLQKRLEGKVERIKEGVAEWQSAGRDPSAVGTLMNEFSQLMEAGKVKQAEELADQALEQLKKKD